MSVENCTHHWVHTGTNELGDWYDCKKCKTTKLIADIDTRSSTLKLVHSKPPSSLDILRARVKRANKFKDNAKKNRNTTMPRKWRPLV